MPLSLIDPYEPYITAGTQFARMSAPSGATGQMVYARFGEGPRPLLAFVDTGLVYPGNNNQMGDPSLLRYFYGVKFGGKGTLYLRAFVDDVLVQQGYVTLEEDAFQASYLNMPRGGAVGYGLRLQISGLAWWRYYEIDWDPVQGGEE